MSKIVDEDADLKAPEAVFVSPLQRALQTAALMPLVSSGHFLSLCVGGCILASFRIKMFKSLQTLRDCQDPWSSLFRYEIHDLPAGRLKIPGPLYLSIFIRTRTN